MQIISKIVTNVLTALYQPFWFAVILSVLFMFVYKAYPSIIQAMKEWIFWFKSDSTFRRIFFLVFYTVMILFRTLLNRNMWANPVSNVIGVWGLYNAKGELTTECIENLALFIPFTILLLWTDKERILPRMTMASVLWNSTKIVFLFSFAIEMLQLFLRLGTWQLSDLFYNTLGGVIGGLIYYIGYKIKPKRKNNMKNTALLIMAAGIGSRFGGGIKQLEPVGLHNEIIMDYSIHDAIKAGFNKIIFVIRKDIEADFRERIGNRVEAICEKKNVEISYAFQDLNNVPGEVPEGRTKPWGTGQAVLAAKELIHEPFAVINADDYYGKEAFRQLHDWLVLDHADNAIAMAGFILKNTLSDNGGVTRGVCKVAEGHTHITDVVETSNIIKTDDGASADGVELNPESYVSMNFWGFPAKEGCAPAYLDVLEQGFKEFFENDVKANPLKAEYLLPTHIGGLLRDGKYTVKVLETKDKWFGVTYKEDKEAVVQSFKKLIEDDVYREELYIDL